MQFQIYLSAFKSSARKFIDHCIRKFKQKREKLNKIQIRMLEYVLNFNEGLEGFIILKHVIFIFTFVLMDFLHPDSFTCPLRFAPPAETFVRADGSFIPFAEDFNMNNVTTTVKGVGQIGDVHIIDLQSPISSLIGRQVVKVGRSSGLTTGTIMAYALEYNDEKGICFLTDFLVVGENQQTFDLEGDSGSLILLTGQTREKPQPVGIIWGGTANRGRLKLKVGQPPENWTSGVDLGRLLDLLELDLITTNEGLQGMHSQDSNFLVCSSLVGSFLVVLMNDYPVKLHYAATMI